MAKSVENRNRQTDSLPPSAMVSAAAQAGGHIAAMAELLGINTRAGRFALLRCILNTVDGATILTAVTTGNWLAILGGVKWAEVINCVQKSLDDDGSFTTPGDFIGDPEGG